MRIHIELDITELDITELNQGDIFRYKGKVYLKCAKSTCVQNAVNLEDGVLVIITKGARVLPLKGVSEIRG